MNWSFDDLKTLKDFSSYLSSELDKVGKTDLSNELKDWKDTYFTTSTEYLGELRILLDKILSSGCNNLPDTVNADIKSAIGAINKAFGFAR